MGKLTCSVIIAERSHILWEGGGIALQSCPQLRQSNWALVSQHKLCFMWLVLYRRRGSNLGDSVPCLWVQLPVKNNYNSLAAVITSGKGIVLGPKEEIWAEPRSTYYMAGHSLSVRYGNSITSINHSLYVLQLRESWVTSTLANCDYCKQCFSKHFWICLLVNEWKSVSSIYTYKWNYWELEYVCNWLQVIMSICVLKWLYILQITALRSIAQLCWLWEAYSDYLLNLSAGQT